MMMIDRAMGEINEAVTWHTYLGEGLTELSLYGGETRQEAEMCLAENKIALAAGVNLNAVQGAVPAHYTANASARFSYLAISAASTALKNTWISVRIGSELQYDGPFRSPIVVQTDYRADNLELVAAVHEPGTETGAISYSVAVQKLNSATLDKLWVKQTATDPVPPQDKFERIWAIRDFTTPKENYDSGLLDDGAHNVYAVNLTQYGVMVDTLSTCLYFNAEAPGTAEDGGNENCHLVISEYGVDDPQTVDSRSYVSKEPGSGKGRLVNARFRLDPSKNGTQVFRFAVVNEADGTVGVYYLTVYRSVPADAPLQLQTHLSGKIKTANTKGKYIANITLYRKDDSIGFNNIMELTTPTVDDGGNIVAAAVPVRDGATYAERFQAVLDAGLLTGVWTGQTNADGTYHLATGEQNFNTVGTYMLVFSWPGYLDAVTDNIRIHETYAEAQYAMIGTILRPGDVNGDGVIDEMDVDIYDLYIGAVTEIQTALENYTGDESEKIKELHQIMTEQNYNPHSPEMLEPIYDMVNKSGDFPVTSGLLDFTGDGKLSGADLSHIIITLGYTTDTVSWRDNVRDSKCVILKPYAT